MSSSLAEPTHRETTPLAPSATPARPSSESTRRRLSDRQARTVQTLTDATVEELRAVGYEGLSVRRVAKRAGVAPATAYTYFGSREHLVTEVFWRRLVALADTDHDSGDAAAERVCAAMTDLALLVADEPEVAAACTVAMMSIEPDVLLLRDRIGAEMHRRMARALGEDADPEVLTALGFVISGALVHTGTGHLTYSELPGRLRGVVRLLLDDGDHSDGPVPGE